MPITIQVRQGVFRGRYLALALLVLGIPFLFFGIYTYSFERRRWSNSTEGTSGMSKTPLTLIVFGIAAVLGALIGIIKAFGQGSSDE